MRPRRAARELALQALYQFDLREGDEGERDLGLFWSHFDAGEGGERAAETESFARALVDGVRANRERIDELISVSAEHWRLPRLSRVDLNLLRLATFELFGRPEIPTAVTINEAVEIARRFGSEDSGAFVHGVLDHVAGLLGVREKAEGET